jgi:RNA polymerase sigma factor (sigma-70 family)
MAANRSNKLIQQLLGTVRQDGAEITDAELLGRFIECRDEVAFAALVRRHGPMVWGVCRRSLNHHDAEDAFQATFLILARKATSITPREMVPNWLHGVAYRTALQAKRTFARRRARESQVTEIPDPESIEHNVWSELQPLLDQELSRLPGRYRVAILLCDLEGKTRTEAARQLRCPEGAVAGRLARARVMLAKRLRQRGVLLSGIALEAVLSEAAAACVPRSVASATIKTGLFAAGQAAATGPISVTVGALAEGVLKNMLLTRLKLATMLFLVVGALGGGVAVLALPAVTPGQTETPTEARIGDGVATAKTGNEDAKKDEERLQGVWEVVSVVHEGKSVEEQYIEGQVWVFLDNTIKGISGKPTYSLNPSQTPKAFEMTAKSRRSGEVETGHGIYELRGDDLKIAIRWTGNERPTEFKSTKDNLAIVTVFKRVKFGK